MFIEHGGHSENIPFFIDLSSFLVVLGHVWLIKHNLQINWGSRLKPIMQWGPNCISHCSQNVPLSSSPRDKVNYDSDEDGEGGGGVE